MATLVPVDDPADDRLADYLNLTDAQHRRRGEVFLCEGVLVIRRALELSASAMILVHNHPSGDPAPSRADIDMTRQIVEAARVFNIQVHDHLVVGREGTASFKALGLI